MNYRDYTKEIGASARKNTVPWPIALVILGILALGVGWYAAGHSGGKSRSDGEPAPAVAQPGG